MKKYCVYFYDAPCTWIWAATAKEARQKGKRIAKLNGYKFSDIGDCCGW